MLTANLIELRWEKRRKKVGKLNHQDSRDARNLSSPKCGKIVISRKKNEFFK